MHPRTPWLHSVALEYLLATLTQLRAILLQTLLNRAVVAQPLTAKTLCVSRARLLLRKRYERPRPPGGYDRVLKRVGIQY
jgi:hypothetical protein